MYSYQLDKRHVLRIWLYYDPEVDRQVTELRGYERRLQSCSKSS